MKHGLLSNERALRLKVKPDSVAMTEIQERRDVKTVPGGLKLHRYVNLYFNARNPMMSRRRALHMDLGVVSVSRRVLDLPDVVVCDGNAASDYSRFDDVASGLPRVDQSLTFAEWWTHDDFYEYLNHKRAMCAEVLVPHVVPAEYVRGAYVSGDEALAKAKAEAAAAGISLKFKINRYLYFQGPKDD